MITLNASGSSVIFTFDGNSTYLNDGAITVPKNSLALIVDESDMVTFRKAASNDIFVSANIAEFGMTKDELMAWYKANMVSSSGGGGGGVTPEEVQTMIDESISGKADSSDVYTTGQTSGATEIANALSAKVDADFDNSLGFDINDDLGVYAEGNSEDIVFNTASSKVKEYTFPSVYTNGSNNLYKVGYNSSVSLELNQSFSGTVSTTKAIGVKYLDTNDELKECWWDYSNNAFTINSDYSANNSVRLSYNSSTHTIALRFQNNRFKTIVTIMVGGDYYIASSSNPTEADCYISYIKIYTSVKKLQSVLNEKQRQLTAGDGIKLDYNGNISANIKVTGDTREKVFNKATSATSINSLEETSISFNVNTGYTGDTTSTWFNLNVRDEYGQAYIKYDAQNDSFSIQGGGDNITMSYSAHVLTVTAHKITAIDSNNGFAALNDFDNVGCLFGKVYTNSNVYTIQDAIDSIGGGGTDAPISASTGTDSVKENYVNNVASGSYSHAEGRGTSASGNSSHAEGRGTSAKGNYAHAEGHSTVASGDSSHAEGELTNANGMYSHAEGTNTKANGSNSHAEGKYSQASGQTSHAEGDNTRANGIKSHAEGGSTVANGESSHAEGSNTIANNQAEHASGMYNVSNTGETASAQTLFSVGNGGWDETAQDIVRHNAFEVRQNGDIYIASGNTDIKLQDALGQGGGCEVEETIIYDRITGGYVDTDGKNKASFVILDYLEDKSTANYQLAFIIGDANNDYVNAYINFDYPNHSSSSTDTGITEYLTVEYVNDIQDFKVTIKPVYQSSVWIKQIYNVGTDMNLLVPFYTINSGSPCTVISTDVVGLSTKIKNIADKSVNYAYIRSNKDVLTFNNGKNNGESSSSNVSLEELDGSNNVLKPNIKVGTGVSGWTEVGLSDSTCNLSDSKVKGFTTFRISGDTTQLNNWNLQIAVGYNNNYTWDSVQWDDNENTFVLSKSWDMFSAATATWDSNTSYLTVSYPQTVTVDGEERQTEFYYVNSQQCQYGNAITKFEYYAELQQALKPYVQETRAALGGLSLVKLTKAEYDALATKDDNVLYIVVPNP